MKIYTKICILFIEILTHYAVQARERVEISNKEYNNDINNVLIQAQSYFVTICAQESANTNIGDAYKDGFSKGKVGGNNLFSIPADNTKFDHIYLAFYNGNQTPKTTFSEYSASIPKADIPQNTSIISINPDPANTKFVATFIDKNKVTIYSKELSGTKFK